MGCVSKVDKYSFGVADVEIAVGFRRETRPDCTASSCEMRVTKVGVDLGVFTGFMQISEKAFFENGLLRRIRRGAGTGCCRRCFCFGSIFLCLLGNV